ncbi:hypothetical protein [Flavobacterium sp.]|uniref:hypothetical protein n=1 Tax=Flavobacterium sp. TaxID=239 RepID=UPI002604BD07|nr:hypothetical protein [Flavobacterium sp.]
MALDQNTGGEITLAEAQEYVNAFRAKYPQEVKAFFIGAVNITKILNQENCIGIRIYNGYNDKENRMNQIMVGVDKDEKDMTKGVIMNRMVSCPYNCDNQSPLMT